MAHRSRPARIDWIIRERFRFCSMCEFGRPRERPILRHIESTSGSGVCGLWLEVCVHNEYLSLEDLLTFPEHP